MQIFLCPATNVTVHAQRLMPSRNTCALIQERSLLVATNVIFPARRQVTSVPKWPVYGRARPSRRAFGENSPSKARIFVILPVYMWFWARSEGIHHWEPAWELLLTFRWSFERLNISIHLILWCPPWPALLKNKFCSILTFLANLDKKKKIKNVNLARLCARLKPVFLSKKGPSKARLLTKMSSSEELGTLPKGWRMVPALHLIVDNHGVPTLIGYCGEWPQVFI